MPRYSRQSRPAPAPRGGRHEGARPVANRPQGGSATGVIMVRGRGTGFVTLPGYDEDIRIETTDLGEALDGDVVELALLGKKEGRETGKVVRVIERAKTLFVGTIIERAGGVYLKADSRRVHVHFRLPGTSPAATGQKAVVRLGAWKDGEAHAEVVELLGQAGDHETEMQAIIKAGGFAVDFPPDVQKAAEKLYAEKERIFADALKDPKRRDMRDVTTFTIDPKDAKDFDDALSLRELDGGRYEIGIHIADVSHYVREGEPIDAEAQERGTSIYLVDRVIPMLPEVLSNDLCSLRPNEDRLAFSAVFVMNADGGVSERWFGQTIIHSDKRFSYEEAQEVLDTKGGPHLAELSTLMAISRKLRAKRQAEGAIAFETDEVKFELDPDGRPIAAYVKQRTETMLMIEDFMLLANREVAEYIYRLSKDNGRDMAFVYRVHGEPDPEKIEDLAIFLRALGYEFRTQKGIVEGRDINKLLAEIDGKPEANLIRTATIRSMAKAVYTTKNIGHFGLAFKFYTHFTSPIRRYPDLMSHRLLRKHLDGEPISGGEAARYEKLSIQSSEREVVAVNAERDSIKFKQVELMKDKVGQTFDGIITGVTEWGIYVEEKTTKAEGMIRLANIKGDYFTTDPKNYRVRGERTKKVYALGDEVKVKLTAANLEDRQLDFVLV